MPAMLMKTPVHKRRPIKIWIDADYLKSVSVTPGRFFYGDSHLEGDHLRFKGMLLNLTL